MGEIPAPPPPEGPPGQQQEAKHYVNGYVSILTKDEEKDWRTLSKDLEKAQKDRLILSIPYNDPYWAKKAELDAFVASKRRGAIAG